MKYLSIQDNTHRASTDDLGTTHEDGQDDAKLPCYYAPFPPNPHFYGREDLLKRIEDLLCPTEPNVDGRIRSIALWATAGIGKTQITLEYANRQRNKGIPAVFWIASEDESSSAKAFTEIASILDLPGASDARGHDQNRLLVVRWLQCTSKSFILFGHRLFLCKLKYHRNTLVTYFRQC